MTIGKIGRLSVVILMTAQTAACGFDAGTMDLRTIERSRWPNDALACPTGLCRAKPDLDSPIFSYDKQYLLDRVETVITLEPRTALVRKDIGLDQMVFVQRSALFGFPDTIWIQALDLDKRTSFIAYSRSNYGYWDLGVNRNRLRDWLQKVTRAITKDPAQTPK